jgi:hypothetical protein
MSNFGDMYTKLTQSSTQGTKGYYTVVDVRKFRALVNPMIRVGAQEICAELVCDLPIADLVGNDQRINALNHKVMQQLLPETKDVRTVLAELHSTFSTHECNESKNRVLCLFCAKTVRNSHWIQHQRGAGHKEHVKGWTSTLVGPALKGRTLHLGSTAERTHNDNTIISPVDSARTPTHGPETVDENTSNDVPRQGSQREPSVDKMSDGTQGLGFASDTAEEKSQQTGDDTSSEIFVLWRVAPSLKISHV